MPLIFERFIRNFYKHEQSEYIIKREDIHWDFEICEGSKAWVPKMQTDVSLISTSQKIIIETKYYKDALVKNFDSFKFRTSHLNQLNSYLDNIENLGKKEITGILLYPLAADNEEINFVAKYSKGTIKVKTVNLNANWKDIHQRLIELI